MPKLTFTFQIQSAFSKPWFERSKTFGGYYTYQFGGLWFYFQIKNYMGARK